MEKNIHDIGNFLGGNLNFTIRVFTWGLANDHICKKLKNLQNISVTMEFDLGNIAISNLRGQSQWKSITIRLTA